MDDLYAFLNLAGLLALLLGGVGVASAIYTHINQKRDTVAVLRCLGASVGQTVAIYLLQGVALGLFGALAGALLGVSIQMLFPRVLADFLPFAVDFHVSWSAVALGMGQGLAICILFTLLPLLSLRRVSPLAALRSFVEGTPLIGFRILQRVRRADPLVLFTIVLLVVAIVVFCIAHTRHWREGVGLAAGLGLAFALLAGVARAILWMARRLVRPWMPFVWRQGLANLHRPNNRTVLTMLSLGLGVFLVLTLYLLQRNLLVELEANRAGTGANLVLFDIQPDQKAGVTELLRAQGQAVVDEAPLVTMRLSSIKGRTVEDILADPKGTMPHWILRREYRSSFRDHLRAGEELIAGQWIGRWERPAAVPSGRQNETQKQIGKDVRSVDPLFLSAVPISVEEGIAKEMGLGLGDKLGLDVQGIPMEAQVVSLRRVDWHRVEPNFFLLFPRGALEEAPATFVMLARAASPAESARVQRALVQSFPNVSAIDVTLILQTLDAILAKVSLAVRFMALFTVLTGLLVLAGALLTGRYQRLRESILLRTLGASRAQILRIQWVEYLSLGLLAALTGNILALGSSWALAVFVFHLKWFFMAAPLFWGTVIVVLLTLVMGLFLGRGIASHPPLELLRTEL